MLQTAHDGLVPMLLIELFGNQTKLNLITLNEMIGFNYFDYQTQSNEKNLCEKVELHLTSELIEPN